MDCTLGPKRLFPSLGKAVFLRDKPDKLTAFVDREVSVQGTEAKTVLAIALAIDKDSAIDVQNDSPSHAALGLALVRAVIFGMVFFFSCYGIFSFHAIGGRSCLEYLPADVT